MRKFLAILSALLIAASLCACNNDGEEETTDGKININSGNVEETGADDETGSEITVPDVDESKDPGDYSYTEKNDKIYVLSPSGALNLRTADYVIKTSVETGTELDRVAVSTDGIWSKVRYVYEGEELYLYVNNKYITSLADLDAGFTDVEKTLVSIGSLKIHIAPEKDYDWQVAVKIIGWYTEGSEIKVVGVNNETGWYKVEFTPYGSENTTFGYITSDPDFFEAEDSADVEDSSDSETGTNATENAGK